jgi:hypothetical protein
LCTPEIRPLQNNHGGNEITDVSKTQLRANADPRNNAAVYGITPDPEVQERRRQAAVELFLNGALITRGGLPPPPGHD